jgi:hypothetical protein
VKKVLLLAYLFPPIANSGTQRPWKFSKYLANYGWEPTVVTAANFEGHQTDPALVSDLPEHVRVVRVPMLNEQVGDTVARLAGGGRLGRTIGNAISWRMRRRWQSPDLYALWKPTVLRQAMAIFNARGFDAIYATGFPWSSLLIGCELSKATGRPLVADFRDLWAGETLFRNERPPLEQELALERSVVAQAATVVTASASIARHLAAAHPMVDQDKFIAIHNGFDAADFAREQPPRAQRFRVVFTGVWKDGYNPSALYDSIDWIRRSDPALLDDVEVIAAGFRPGEAQRRGLADYINERGVVPHDEALSLMRSADILYLPHSVAERQWVVPGKVYEYLASGSPVLGLMPPGQETAAIIGKVGGGVTVSPEHPGTLFEALADAFRRKKLEVPERDVDALNAFERRRLTAKLARVLDHAASHATVPHTARRIGTGSSSARLATRSS